MAGHATGDPIWGGSAATCRRGSSRQPTFYPSRAAPSYQPPTNQPTTNHPPRVFPCLQSIFKGVVSWLASLLITVVAFHMLKVWRAP